MPLVRSKGAQAPPGRARPPPEDGRTLATGATPDQKGGHSQKRRAKPLHAPAPGPGAPPPKAAA